jgi:hypothetical protein
MTGNINRASRSRTVSLVAGTVMFLSLAAPASASGGASVNLSRNPPGNSAAYALSSSAERKLAAARARVHSRASGIVRTFGSDPLGEKWISAGPTGAVHCGLIGVFGITFNILGPCSGRVTALAVDPSDPSGNTIYLGAAQGGVWKTTDGGSTWTPLPDHPVQPDGAPSDQYTIAVGSITVTASGVVYVGTGEPNNGGGNFYGAGILKSDDGGHTWTQLGLGTFWRQSIFNVVVSPSNPDMILAASTATCPRFSPFPPMCDLFGRPMDSGLWSSTDGGKTWNDIGLSLPGINAGTSFTSLALDAMPLSLS